MVALLTQEKHLQRNTTNVWTFTKTILVRLDAARLKLVLRDMSMEMTWWLV
jgi:hypothetical protein